MGSLPYNLDPNKGPVGKFFSGLSLIELEKVEWGAGSTLLTQIIRVTQWSIQGQPIHFSKRDNREP